MTNGDIDTYYNYGMENGAIGGKLVGAGSGGFLMFYCKNKMQLRDAFSKKGIKELPFQFNFSGSNLLCQL